MTNAEAERVLEVLEKLWVLVSEDLLQAANAMISPFPDADAFCARVNEHQSPAFTLKRELEHQLGAIDDYCPEDPDFRRMHTLNWYKDDTPCERCGAEGIPIDGAEDDEDDEE